MTTRDELRATEMIERVARALCNAIGVPEEGLVAENRNYLIDLKPAWVTQLPKARAAIEAMREPTDEMTEAGSNWVNPKLCYQAMIDTALADKAAE